jgi:tetratricopeptide (TPR) repeat protein
LKQSPFVGRSAELARVEQALAWAVSGSGHVILIAGDPGIGKTRLAKQVGESAESKAFKVLWGRCWEGGGAPALWPWIEVIREYARQVDDAALRADLGPQTSHIASLVPELAERLGVAPVAAAEGEAAKFLMFDAVANLLRAASSVSPLLVVIDDLHSADPSSLLLLQFLADRVGDTSLVIVGAYRNRQPDLPPKSAELISEVATRAHLLELHGLASEEIDEFVREVTGKDVPSDLVETIGEKTAGNPLFLDEVLRTLGALPENGDLTAVSIRIPNHLGEQIRRRLETQSDELLGALGAAAVIGREFEISTLAAASELKEAELVHQLEIAEKAGVVTLESLGRYSFAHVLFQETLYEQLPTSMRMELHLRVARVLEQSRDEVTAAPQVASHYVRLMSAGYATQARVWSRRAGEAAMRASAFEEAARHFEEALQSLLHEHVSPPEHVELILEKGRALRSAGDGDRAREAMREAVQLAREFRLAEHLARAVLEFTPALGSINPADREMLDLVDDALDLLGDSDPELRARLLCRWCSLTLWVNDKVEERQFRLEEAQKLARHLESPSLRAVVALTELPLKEDLPDESLLQEARSVQAVAEESHDGELILEAQAHLIYRRLLLGDRKRAREELGTYARLAEDALSPFHRWQWRMMEACQLLVDGEFEQSVALSEEALEIASTAPIYDPIIYLAAQRGCSWGVVRDPEGFAQFLPLMEMAVHQYPTQALPRLGFAHFHSYQGQPEEAQKWLDTVGPAPVAALPKDSRWLGCMCLLGEIAFHLELPEVGERVKAELEPYAGCAAFHTRGGTFWGIPRLSAAAGAAAAGFKEEAEELFEQALRFTATIGARPHQGHAHYYYGWFLAKQGDEPRARTHLTRARSIYDSLEMAYPASRVEEVMKSIGPDAAGTGEAVLRKEGDVWTVGLGSAAFRLKDIKGLHYLSRLISRPEREISALDLASGGPAQTDGAMSDDLSVGVLDPGLEALDDAARRAYTARIKELQEEIDDVEDSAVKSRLQEEMDALVDALTDAIGLGGRTRKTSSAAEKARLSVTRAIRSAIERIEENDPVLGKHLSVSVRTGIFCSYSPDSSSQIRWTF